VTGLLAGAPLVDPPTCEPLARVVTAPGLAEEAPTDAPCEPLARVTTVLAEAVAPLVCEPLA
jgi:hypothetical protein